MLEAYCILFDRMGERIITVRTPNGLSPLDFTLYSATTSFPARLCRFSPCSLTLALRNPHASRPLTVPLHSFASIPLARDFHAYQKGADDFNVKVWSAASGRLLATCRGHEVRQGQLARAKIPERCFSLAVASSLYSSDGHV